MNHTSFAQSFFSSIIPMNSFPLPYYGMRAFAHCLLVLTDPALHRHCVLVHVQV